jgi:hypothetical protein
VSGSGRVRLAVIMLVFLAGCHQARRKEPVSTISTADPTLAKQLVGGFYKIEAKSWRWTARQFVVSLLPPPGSERNGAKLSLHFFIPEANVAKLGPMTLKAEIDDLVLPPETYSRGGDCYYVREIPAKLLRTNLIPVIFSFDKAMPPAGPDGRELGAVVSLISLISN